MNDSSFPSIEGYKDGQPLDETNLGRPVAQLTRRTDYLFAHLQAALGDDPRQSLRLVDVALGEGTYGLPDVGDAVFLNQDSRAFEKALASVELLETLATADPSAYAVGILVLRNTAGTVGTVSIQGRTTCESAGEPWDLSALMQTDEEFQSGPVYLSNTEAGRLTRFPTTIEVYMGIIIDGEAGTASGGYCILCPQIRNFAERHTHRHHRLSMTPAGTHEIVGDNPDYTHLVHGYAPDSTYESVHGEHNGADGLAELEDTLALFFMGNLIGLTVTNVTKGESGVITDNDTSSVTATLSNGATWDTGDEYFISDRTRLWVDGRYTSDSDTTYTLQLTDNTGMGVPVTDNEGFDDVHMRWVSSDATEGSGLVRITSYEQYVPIGTKGIIVALQNMLETAVDPMWSWVEIGNSNLNRTAWSITVPTTTTGWARRRERVEFASSEDRDYRILAHSDAPDNSDSRQQDRILVSSSALQTLTYNAVPADGDTVTIGGNVFEFDDDGATTANNHVVTITTGDADATWLTFAMVVNDLQAPFQFAGLHADSTQIHIGHNSSVAYSSAAVTGSVATYAGGTQDIDGTATLLVRDDYGAAIGPDDGLWSSAGPYVDAQTDNGFTLLVTPYDADGVLSVTTEMEDGEVWVGAYTDPAPGAVLRYSIGQDPVLSAMWPPRPLDAASLVVNGTLVESEALFPEDPVYRIAVDGIYWYGLGTQAVPFPRDWVSHDSSGDSMYAQRGVIHLVHGVTGTTGPVTSLKPAPDSPVKLYRCGTRDEATTGDLEVDVELSLRAEPGGKDTYHAVVGSRGNLLLTNPMVSKVEAGPGIRVVSAGGAPAGRGSVKIQLASAVESPSDFDTLSLRNAKQASVGRFPYVRFMDWDSTSSTNIKTGFVAFTKVPADLTGTFRFHLVMTLFGEEDIPFTEAASAKRLYTGFDLSYSVLRDLDPTTDSTGTLTDGLIEPPESIRLEIPLGDPDAADGSTPVYSAYNPMRVHTDPTKESDEPARIYRAFNGPFPRSGDLKASVVTADMGNLVLHPGNLIAVELQRSRVADTATQYTAPVGIMRFQWYLTGAE